ALLAVSDLGVLIADRVSSSDTSGAGTGGAAPAGTSATINLHSGSTLSSGGALTFDTPGTITTAGAINGKGASWSLSSSSIAFTGSGASSTDSLNIDSNLLGSLQQAGSVRLSSAGAIDIQTAVSLGASSSGAAPTLNALT